MFRAYDNRGFQISFANGLTFSVMFGRGNYCERRNASENSPKGSKDAEFAVFETGTVNRGDYVFSDGCGNPGTGYTGWISPEDIAKTMAIVAEHKKDDPYTGLVAKIKAVFDQTPA